MEPGRLMLCKGNEDQPAVRGCMATVRVVATKVRGTSSGIRSKRLHHKTVHAFVHMCGNRVTLLRLDYI